VRPDSPSPTGNSTTTHAPAPPPRSPYQGLAPYAEDDAPFFFGRDGEREIIIANLLAYRLTVVYGTSGVGKTSVLRAGVAHQLQASAKGQLAQGVDPALLVAVFDAWRDDPIAGIQAAVRRAVTDVFGSARQLEPASGGLVETLRHWTTELSCDLIIVLDQMEEYFLYHPGEDGNRTFAVEFPPAVNAADLPVNFLVSIREDALSRLDRFKSRIPGMLSNLLPIQHLDLNAARAAIQDPLEEYNRRGPDGRPWSIEPELVELVLEELRPGRVVLGATGEGAVDATAGPDRQDQRVETPFLQLVMARLWNTEAAAGSRVLRAATLRRLDGARRIVRSHLDQAMEALAPDERDLAARIFHYVVTPSGSKIAYTAADLAGLADRPEARVSGLLERLTLGDARVLRPVGPAPEGSGEARYEVFHDVLAPAILDWRARHVAAQAAEERLREERDRLREERDRLRRRSGIAAAIGLLVIIAIALAFFALDQRRRAEEERERAASQSLVTQAEVRASEEPDVSVLLSLAAYRLRPNDEARSGAMLQADRRRDARALLSGAAGALGGAAFSPDGRLLAAGDFNGVRVWEVSTRRLVASLEGATGRVNSVAFSPDGRLVAAGDAGSVRLWSLASRRQVAELTRNDRRAYGGAFNGVAFSPDGRLLAAVGPGGMRLWEAHARWRPVVVRDPHAGTADAVAFSGDGRTLAFASSKAELGEIVLWDARQRRVRRTLQSEDGHFGGVAAIALSPDGRTLVSAGSDDGQILAWSLASRRPRLKLLTDVHGASTIAFSPDGRTVATAGQDSGTVELWDAGRRARIRGLTGNIGLVDVVSFSPDGRTLAASGSDRAVALFDVPPRHSVGHKGFVNSLAFSPDGRTLASAGDDFNVVLWDVPTRTPRATLPGHGDQVTGVAFAPDGRTLASAALDGTVLLWDAKDSRRLRVPAFTARDVYKLAFSPTGSVLALAGNDGAVTLWDSGRWVRLGVLRGHRGRVNTLAFAPDGRRLASGGADGLVIVWDLASRAPLTRRAAHSDNVNRVAFSPDGRALASAGDDRVALVWDVDRGTPTARLPGENVQFSPDGRTLATQQPSGSAEARIVLWDHEGRTRTGSLTYGIGETFSPDGRLLATAGDDVVIHDLDAPSWQRKLCALAGRELTDAEWGRFAPGVKKRAICK
jgi:WD40 repeat protein